MINGQGLGRVVTSDNPNYCKNDIVSGMLNWAEYTIVKSGNMLKKLESEEFPLSYHVGIFGSSGLTAYGGLFHVCKPKKGDKLLSQQLLVPLVDLLKEKLGFDDAFNYREEKDLNSTLQKYFPDGISLLHEIRKTSLVKYDRCHLQANHDPGIFGFRFYTNDFKYFMPMTTDCVRAGKLCVLEDISYGIESIPSAFVGLFRVSMKLVDVDTMHIFPIMMLILSLVTGLIAFPFNDFDVFEYGASGSGQTDDSQAFVDAWRDACKADTKTATVIAPRVGSFLLRPLMYSITSGSPKTWKRLDSSQWIAFKDATGLNIYGSGIIDGQGIRWWDQSCRYHPNQ
ncbi:putative polygalacturonase, partial [Tanacetum coccineum]